MREDAADRTTAPRAPGPCNVQRQAVVALLQAARLRCLCEGFDGRDRTQRELLLSHRSRRRVAVCCACRQPRCEFFNLGAVAGCILSAVQGSQHVPDLVSKCLCRIHRIREVLAYSNAVCLFADLSHVRDTGGMGAHTAGSGVETRKVVAGDELSHVSRNITARNLVQLTPECCNHFQVSKIIHVRVVADAIRSAVARDRRRSHSTTRGGGVVEWDPALQLKDDFRAEASMRKDNCRFVENGQEAVIAVGGPVLLVPKGVRHQRYLNNLHVSGVDDTLAARRGLVCAARSDTALVLKKKVPALHQTLHFFFC
mmetsp:Transcript_6120/g.10613  ORF Transcript_6120/g.10613 Transcript_6120/m.10613 type:complete len:312 (+) Transcript_6120:1375-2310(+)